MASTARKNIFAPGSEGTFHCWSRCVRRAHLMGDDSLTGKNYDHRRDWLYDRLAVICECYCIDVLFFAVLANHFHLVLTSHPRLVKRLGDWEVARRWLLLYPGKRVLEGRPPEPTEQQIKALAADKTKMKEIRKRLSDVSWFMRSLKEPIARRANREDECSGCFFDSRFKCRVIEDDEARLAIGLYVDLNLFRAGECDLPWESPHCSAGARLLSLGDGKAPSWLAEFHRLEGQSDEQPSTGGRRATDLGCLAMTFDQYTRLLMWAATKPGKGRTLPRELAELIERQGLRPERLSELLDQLPKLFPRVVGAPDSLRQRAAEQQRHWYRGVGHADQYFQS